MCYPMGCYVGVTVSKLIANGYDVPHFPGLAALNLLCGVEQ